MKPCILLIAIILGLGAVDGTMGEGTVPYKNDPAIVAKLEALEAGHALMLGKFKVLPEDAGKYSGALKTGPGRRDYGNKMPYAPDRETAMYCGANHQSPHRLNDVWEFHLGSNTWHLICPPGLDAARLRGMDNKAGKARKAIAEGKDVEKNKAFLEKEYEPYEKKWWSQVAVTNGYLQDKVNGGPVQPWHTWDGVTYDEKTKRLYWAVLDSDNSKDPKQKVHINKAKNFAKVAGLDPEKTAAMIKPGTSMYMYDPDVGRWAKQMGEGPFPLMRAMGATLHYLPDIDKTIWYACVGCTPGGYTEGMWAYDAKSNKWANLIDGNKVSGLMRTKKAPGEEIQAAYSVKHKKLVVVNKEMTFVYDVTSNAWTRVTDNAGHGDDSHSVFDYDSKADRFLLVSKKGGKWSKEPWAICAYDVGANKWEPVEIKGDALPQDPPDKGWLAQQNSGYYDPKHNVLVLYLGRSNRTWVYRHAK